MSEIIGFRCNKCGRIVDLDATDGIPKDATRIPAGALIGGLYYAALDFCNEACFMAWLEETGRFDFISKEYVEKSFTPNTVPCEGETGKLKTG